MSYEMVLGVPFCLSNDCFKTEFYRLESWLIPTQDVLWHDVTPSNNSDIWYIPCTVLCFCVILSLNSKDRLQCLLHIFRNLHYFQWEGSNIKAIFEIRYNRRMWLYVYCISDQARTIIYIYRVDRTYSVSPYSSILIKQAISLRVDSYQAVNYLNNWCCIQ